MEIDYYSHLWTTKLNPYSAHASKHYGYTNT